MKFNHLIRVIGFCAICSILMSCAVGMALHGKKEPNLGAIQVGQDRSLVIMNLGQPIQTIAEEGKRIDIFELQFGNEPSAGRALGHGAMDVLTLGAWEVIGTPIEGFSGSKQKLMIEYDENDKVKTITSGTDKPRF